MNSLRELLSAVGAAIDERDARLTKRLDELAARISSAALATAPPPPSKRYLRINEAAKLIGMSPSWLRKVARQPDGPQRIHAGKCIIYDSEHLVVWLSKRSSGR
jgi:predicted DNA-binding transcriptional regulator AlpA